MLQSAMPATGDGRLQVGPPSEERQSSSSLPPPPSLLYTARTSPDRQTHSAGCTCPPITSATRIGAGGLSCCELFGSPAMASDAAAIRIRTSVRISFTKELQ